MKEQAKGKITLPSGQQGETHTYENGTWRENQLFVDAGGDFVYQIEFRWYLNSLPDDADRITSTVFESFTVEKHPLSL